MGAIEPSRSLAFAIALVLAAGLLAVGSTGALADGTDHAEGVEASAGGGHADEHDGDDERDGHDDGDDELDGDDDRDGNEQTDARQIERCIAIEEPGTYELADDVRVDDAEGACLQVASSDVVLDGSGHAVLGGGSDAVGVRVSDPGDESAEEELSNVTVQDVAVRNWSIGVALGNTTSPLLGSADLEGVAAIGNDRMGVSLIGAESDLENVTAIGNDGHGIQLWESRNVTADGIVVHDNGDYGLYVWDAVLDSRFADVTATANDGNGIELGTDVANVTVAGAHVANNSGAGVSLPQSSAGNAIDHATIQHNGEAGIETDDSTGTAELEDVALRENDGWELDARATDGEFELDASDLQIGDGATAAFEDQSTALDATERDALPPFPDDVWALGDGLNASGLDDADEPAVEATLTYDEDSVEDGEVQLWRHDGDAWSAVDAEVVDGSLEATLSEDGTYAPVAVEQAGDGGDGEADGDGEDGRDDGDARDGDADGEVDYDCDDFDTWTEANEIYEESPGEHGLDGDGDGVPCEGLEGAPDQQDADTDGEEPPEDDDGPLDDDDGPPEDGDGPLDDAVDYDCDDFDTWAEANEVYEESPGEHGLDGDEDGVPCEELEGAPEQEDDLDTDGDSPPEDGDGVSDGDDEEPPENGDGIFDDDGEAPPEEAVVADGVLRLDHLDLVGN